MKKSDLALQGFIVMATLLCSSCQEAGFRKNLIVGDFGGTRNITQTRRIAIFPFPKNNQYSDLFLQFASKELWENRVVHKTNILREYARLSLDPKATYLSEEQAILIAGRVRADSFLIGYKDAENILHLKIVNLNTRYVWTRKRDLLASSSIRVLVDELRTDFENATNIAYAKPIENKIVPLPLSLAILPAENETTNLNAADAFRKTIEVRFKEAKYKPLATSAVDEVLKTTFSITDGGQLKVVPSNELAEKLGVEGLVYIVVHDFVYQNAIAYQNRKVSATVTVKSKDGTTIWIKEISAATGNIAIKPTEIARAVVSSFAKQLFETATDTQLVQETYAATEGMLKRPWWEVYGEIWDF